ncbi:hypothetical protein QFZ30_002192 [Arthrobacter pascens]|nr:hypothetical protein [Arthrobacter pascens]
MASFGVPIMACLVECFGPELGAVDELFFRYRFEDPVLRIGHVAESGVDGG